MQSFCYLSFHLGVFLLSALYLTSPAQAHMNMFRPIPRTHKANPFTTQATVDYDIMAPLSVSKKPFPCGGTKAGPSVQTLKAGDTMNVVIEGNAPHGGGHCEFSISYDGQNFVALSTILRTCLQDATRSFPVLLPSTLPRGRAIFSWSWVNALGNREFYHNCADVDIEGPNNGTFTGPSMVIANVPGYPSIPEMNPGQNDRRDLYSNRSSIEIGPNGVFRPVSPIPPSPSIPTQTVSPPASNPTIINPYLASSQNSTKENDFLNLDVQSPDFLEKFKNRFLHSRFAQSINAALAENGIHVSLEENKPRSRRSRSP